MVERCLIERQTKWDRLCRAIGLLCIGLFFVAAFTSLATYLCRWTCVAPKLGAADAIVVLGSGLYGDGRLGNSSLQRTIHGVVLFQERLSPVLVLLGSEGEAGRPSEAEVRTRLARLLGVPPSAIVTESSAWTTREEAAVLKRLLAPRGIRKILVVTNALHMSRARDILQRAGFDVLPAPANDFGTTPDPPEDRLQLLRQIVEEMAARLYYWLG